MSIRQLIRIAPVVAAVLIVAVGIVTVDVYAQLIPPDEVETLQTISRKLNNRFWKVSQNSCTDNSLNVTIANNILSNVTCDCSFKNNSVCHVTNIQLKGLNLTGPFPSEFGNLTHLQEINLIRNYISGTIPTSLTKIPLVIFAVIDNIMSGSIPMELGQIPTLEELYLEDNHLAGPLPPSLGNLNRLRRL